MACPVLLRVRPFSARFEVSHLHGFALSPVAVWSRPMVRIMRIGTESGAGAWTGVGSRALGGLLMLVIAMGAIQAKAGTGGQDDRAAVGQEDGAVLSTDETAGDASGWVFSSGKTSVTGWAGFGTENGIHEVWRFKGDFTDDYFAGVSIAQPIYRTSFGLSFEVEGQVHHHFGNASYWEGVGGVVARWDRFPWNDTIDTSVAYMHGLSVYSDDSAIEEMRLDKTNRLLNYFAIEVDLALPSQPDWRVVGRLHHRSGVFGLFSDVVGGSNYYALGLRHRF